VPIEELDMSTTLDFKTYRGRTLEELLPQIRAELGPDAIVLRRREGLSGGVAGFFQRSYIEVDARAALPDEPPLEARNDRATAEGLASPAIQALVEQATPFADALARAEGAESDRAHEVLLAAARGRTTTDAGLYGPQPNRDAIEQAAPHEFVADEIAAPRDEIVAPRDEIVAPRDEIVAPRHEVVRPGLGTPRPAAADAAEKRLVAAGLSATLAADVVGEAVAHGIPFAQPRALKRLVRSALARRMPVMADLGPGPRTLAFVGPGGAGKSSAAERLAAAYAQADAEVIVVALRASDGGCGLAARLEPLGVSVIAAADAEQAARRLARREAALTIVDAPAAGPGDRTAIARLADELRALSVDEIHLTLPATLSAAAADELASALAPLGITHVALTHADQTARPGAPVELAVTGRRALSYVCTREAIEPADPTALAGRLLP
jgi:flagellar biosynthesis protein FlhF